jgi:hypothetical protein
LAARCWTWAHNAQAILGKAGSKLSSTACETSQGIRVLALDDRRGLGGEFGDERMQTFGVEGPANFAEGPGRRSSAAQLVHFAKLDGVKTGDDWIEEVEQQQCGVLIEMKFAVVGSVAGGCFVMNPPK